MDLVVYGIALEQNAYVGDADASTPNLLGIRHDLSFDLETLLLAIESAVWQKGVIAESSS